MTKADRRKYKRALNKSVKTLNNKLTEIERYIFNRSIVQITNKTKNDGK